MDNIRTIRSFGVLNRTFLSYISNSLSDSELSFSDSIFLVNIGENEGITQEEISRSLVIDKAAIARSVKKMVKKGYVKIVQSQKDKRAKKLYLTDAGKEFYQFIQEINDKWMNFVMADLSSEDMVEFVGKIEKMSEKARNFNR